ncbi:hypothetical protein CRM22_008509 [Opisthorchis felineus]|uniref:FZ domain-containing protein n=1 Tax=Opisthorchis felineus TaxID=147828 RepID=A0A4S2LBG0_OPIFE|nr:hypothetical protein CRM22_008509 [Opisthorchis felineus]
MNHFRLGWCYFLLCNWLVLCSTVSTFVEDKALEPVEQRRCLKPMPIQIPECQNTFYKFTGMPNLVGQETQFDARHQLQTFKPLITYKCSNKLSFFLCSVYTPMCDVNTRHLIGPCRPLCEHVKARCAPVLRVFDIDWPATLNCSRFPVKNVVGGTMCMEGPQDSEETPLFSEVGDVTTHDEAVKGRASPSKMVGAVENKIPTPDPKSLSRKPGVEEDEQLVSSWIQQFSEFQLTNENNGPRAPHLNRQASAISVMAQTLRHCAFLKKPTSYVYINRTGRCAPLCQAHILFHPDAKTLSIIWTSVLSGICSLLTSVTLVGYLIHSGLFRLTERPVIYITLCQLIYSLGFALSLGLGRETVTCGPDLDSGREIRLQEGLDNSVCALVFMVQYFFAIASSMWWSLLTIHWALQYSYCWCSLCWEPVDSSEDYTSVARSDIECWPHLSNLCSCMTRNSWDKENAVDVIGSQVDNDPSETVNPTNSVFTQPNGLRDCSGVREANTTSRIGSGATQTVFDLSPKMFPPPQVPGPETVCYFAQNGKIIPSCRYITTTTTTTIIANQSRNHRTMNSGNFEQIAVCLAREHVLVWLTAGLLTVGVLVSRQVDADELIPVCSVGRQNTRALGVFVVGPETIVTIAGLISLSVGLLFGLFRRRLRRSRNLPDSGTVRNPSTSYGATGGTGTVGGGEFQITDNSRLLHDTNNGGAASSKQQSCSIKRGIPRSESNKRIESVAAGYLAHKSEHYCLSTDPLERRIGLFCLLYLLPILCVTMCDLYEYLCRDLWLRDTEHKPIDSTSTLSFPPKMWKPEEVVGPNPDIFMLRIFMSLVPGITCSLWTWSVKGCKPWTRLFTRVRSAVKKGLHFTKSNGEVPSSMKFDFLPADQRQNVRFHPRSKETPVYSLNSHPYAVYHYRSTDKHPPIDGWTQLNYPIEPCMVETISHTNGVENQHSSATTPGYYSQAKVGSTIEPHMSDTLSEESPVPPPLPTTSRPQLPARGDPCIGASNSHVSGLAAPTNLLFQAAANLN